MVERGVNGKPFLWEKKQAGGGYVMIDIFEVRGDGCYTVLALDANPLARDDAKGRIIGVGCGGVRTGWVEAYEKARKIADQYMVEH